MRLIKVLVIASVLGTTSAALADTFRCKEIEDCMPQVGKLGRDRLPEPCRRELIVDGECGSEQRPEAPPESDIGPSEKKSQDPKPNEPKGPKK